LTIILSSPLTPPEAAAVARAVNRPMKWVGFDGSEWQLTRPGNPNPRMAPGVKGLHMPPMQVHSSSSPLVPGVELTGYELPARSVYWPLMFRAPTADQWEADHAAFFDSFHPILEGTWTVGDGELARTLPLTGSFDGSYSFDHDPFVTGHALIGVELLAPRPLWRGRPVGRSFSGPQSTPFIPEGGGPPFHITPGSSFQNAEIRNAGDEPSYLTWTLTDEFEAGAKLGFGEALIEVPFALGPGDVLEINTDPASQYATLNGVDCAPLLGFQIFAPIPARGVTALVIQTSGSGTVRASHTPLYWRAF
jgi:hypothetical protein